MSEPPAQQNPSDRLRIVCVSDTHGLHQRLRIPDGDVLVHAGDFSMRGREDEVRQFAAWIGGLGHRWKVVVAGNHDWLFQRKPELARSILGPEIIYLQDAGTTIEGVNFWGTPWQPWFMDWAFNLPRKGQALREKWNLIPLQTDVLITHGPPYGTLDQVRRLPNGAWDPAHGAAGDPLGCEELTLRLHTVRPALHVFGHIHDGYGALGGTPTLSVNASTCNEQYQPVNPAIVVDLAKNEDGVRGSLVPAAEA